METNDKIPDKEQLKVNYLGPIGTAKRDAYERELAQEIAKVEARTPHRNSKVEQLQGMLSTYILYFNQSANAAVEIYGTHINPLEIDIEKLEERVQQQQTYINRLEKTIKELTDGN